MILDLLKQEAAGSVIKVGQSLADAGISLADAYEDFKKERVATARSLDAMKRTLVVQLLSLQKKIEGARAELETCDAAVALCDRAKFGGIEPGIATNG
ncbi:MAG TPA: hypothetical protein VIU82_20640 [Bosea sp. (in: a-proteobacteria)]